MSLTNKQNESKCLFLHSGCSDARLILITDSTDPTRTRLAVKEKWSNECSLHSNA